MPFGVHTFFNLLACLTLAAAHVRTRNFAIGLTLTMLAVYGFTIGPAIGEVRELIALKKNTPFESLERRLAFEDRIRSIATSLEEPIQLAADVATALNEQEGDFESIYGSRAWALKRLHEDTATQFARAAGFGFSRMPSVRAEVIRLAPRIPLPLPLNVHLDTTSSTVEPMRSLHQIAARNFVDPARMGYFRSRSKVSGFESHGLASIEASACGCNVNPQSQWQIVRLELVSLLRHSTPCVYISDRLPDMDKLAEAPIRALNSFELAALPQLTTQLNVVVNQQPTRIEMVGALRAGKTCLECHAGDRGKLLGAFSYELKPLATTDEPSSEVGQQYSLVKSGALESVRH